jgi:hydrogenase-4 component F
MLELIIILPFMAGAITFFVPPVAGRTIIVCIGVVEMVLSCISVWTDKISPATDYFTVSPEGSYVLLITIFLFLIVSLYAVFYLAETEMPREPLFHTCFLFFLGAMSMVCLADHIVVFWIAIEATTLVSAPLILLHRSKGSLEATWKYVIICSVGIALALLGTFFIVLSIDQPDTRSTLTFSNLKAMAGQMNPVWLKAGFIFILIGYGTKMGLAPMHTWLPDAHSEAPAPASALLSGALLNCAFLGIFKIYGLLYIAGLGRWAGDLLSGFGLFSMLLAGFFVFQQNNYKRLLAYSSIENMGIIALGTGVGGLAGFGAMLHILHHSLIKSSLFLSAGNVLLSYGSKDAAQVGSMPRLLPRTFTGFSSGFAGISGFPPFGIFLSELMIIIGLFKNGRFFYAALFVLALILVFSGMSKTFIRMSFSHSNADLIVSEKWGRTIPPLVLLGVSVVFSLWLPQTLLDSIRMIVIQVGGLMYE